MLWKVPFPLSLFLWTWALFTGSPSPRLVPLGSVELCVTHRPASVSSPQSSLELTFAVTVIHSSRLGKWPTTPQRMSTRDYCSRLWGDKREPRGHHTKWKKLNRKT